MPSTLTEHLFESVQLLKTSAEIALNAESAEEFESFERELNRFAAQVREMQQSLWSEDARVAIEHLAAGAPLTPADREVIRTLLICDAERYLALENNFPEWVQELRRLFSEIESKSSRVDRSSLADLRGLLKDASRLVPDIRNYLDEQRRIERFHAAMNQLDDPTRLMMARLLREQLQSEQC
ncbi:MAG: hypothetical protein AMXMBFR13_01400 [Phycisphaerae bacterium]